METSDEEIDEVEKAKPKRRKVRLYANYCCTVDCCRPAQPAVDDLTMQTRCAFWQIGGTKYSRYRAKPLLTKRNMEAKLKKRSLKPGDLVDYGTQVLSD